MPMPFRFRDERAKRRGSTAEFGVDKGRVTLDNCVYRFPPFCFFGTDNVNLTSLNVWNSGCCDQSIAAILPIR